MEVPIVAHRVRKAARRGASVAFLNPAQYELFFKPAASCTAAADALVANLAAVVAAAAVPAGANVPAHLARAVEGVAITDAHRAPRRKRSRASPRLVLLGQIAQRHPQYAELRVARGRARGRHRGDARLLERGRRMPPAPRSRVRRRIAAPGAKNVARSGFDARAMLETPS